MAAFFLRLQPAAGGFLTPSAEWPLTVHLGRPWAAEIMVKATILPGSAGVTSLRVPWNYAAAALALTRRIADRERLTDPSHLLAAVIGRDDGMGFMPFSLPRRKWIGVGPKPHPNP